MFAVHFIDSVGGKYRKIPIQPIEFETVLKSAGHSTVIIAALRNALIMDFYKKNHDPGAIVRLALSALYEAQPLVEETLAVMTDESYLDVFNILEYMLEYEKTESLTLLDQREQLDAILMKNKRSARLSETARENAAVRKQEINDELLKILRIRSIAISVIYKIFKSDRVEMLISNSSTDPNKLFWLAMADPLPEVRDNASTYIYYVSRL